VARFSGPRRLESADRLEGFDCGVVSVDSWLVKHSRSAAAAGSAVTYILVEEGSQRVVGFHALTVASISHEQATLRARKDMPRHPIPVVLLARLGVDRTVQGCGLGAALLGDAVRRALSLAEETGVRLLLAHAIDERALGFYLRFGFERSPSDPFNLQLLIKDIRSSLDSARL
jgi:GNAT superfamily N-acetyltransferase